MPKRGASFEDDDACDRDLLDPTQAEGDSDSVRSGGRRGRPRKAQSLTEKKRSNGDCTADESVTGKLSISHCILLE